MNEVTLPPSPNWYLGNILDCSYNGIIAWGSGHMIVIGKPKENEKALEYSIIRHAHKTKVTCVAFAPKQEDMDMNLIASTGDDNVINIWKVGRQNPLKTLLLQPDVQATAVDWSQKDSSVLYVASSDGFVMSYNCSLNTRSSVSLGKVVPTCLSSCPHDPYLIAVGTKTGLVYIINFPKIVYKLRGHDTEITSLSWCPVENNVISGNSDRDLLLASGGNDRSVFIWRAGGDGRYEMTITLPTTPFDPRHHRNKTNTSAGNWTAIDWIEPKTLLTSSVWGELISWDLSTISKHKPVGKLIHGRHGKGLFCIAHVPIVQDNLENWRAKHRLTIWTLSQDRKVICCSIDENNVEIEYDIFTQGGHVYCIAACPLDTSRIAFGCGDAILRLWNLSEPHTTTFDITTFWQKIKGKIRAISWHPEKENLLAYATQEGRIGMFAITNASKPPVLYGPYHRSVVYNINWGPNPDNQQHVLYSCAEGELVYYNADKPNEEPKSVLKKNCTEFSWKPDYSCLAVGFEDGSISFLDRKFETFGSAKFSTKMVYCLTWHPESTATDCKFSPLKNYLACAFASPTITILDLSNLMDHFAKLQSTNGEVESHDTYKVQEVVATLTGHVESVVCLAWSPFISGQLISGGYDGIVQVWNVETQELIASYTRHTGPVLCCMWSPLNSDLIITGSIDCTLQIWNVTDNEPQKHAPGKAWKRNKNKQQSLKNSMINLAECSISDAPQTVQKPKTVSTKETTKKKIKQAEYLAKSSKTMNDKTVLINSLLNVVKGLKGKEKLENIPCHSMESLLFTTQEDFASFLASEKSAHVGENKRDLITEMDVLSDNFQENLMEAAKEKRLNDYLVSLSAGLSMKIWKEMCEVYAHQLIDAGKLGKAVSYLLCIHKIYKAIKVLQEAEMHQKAYIVARCKLDPDDPVLATVLTNWAEHCVKTHNFEQAAFIYAKLGDFSVMLNYLTRSNDPATLAIAAKVALLCNDETSSKSVADQAVIAALASSNYDLARNIIDDFPYLKYYQTLLLALEAIEEMIDKNIDTEMIENWLEGKPKFGLLQKLEVIAKEYGSFGNDLGENRFLNIVTTEKMLWLAVSHELAAATVSTDVEQKLKRIVTALHSITQFEILNRKDNSNQCNILMEVIIKLDDKSLTDEKSIYAKTDYPVSTSLRAYLCYAFLNWLVCNIKREHTCNRIEIYIDLIISLLDDAVNKQTVEQCLISSNINKLENQICKAREEDANTESLMEKLNELKSQKKQILSEVVHRPNPVMVYGKANELLSKLSLEDDIKIKFEEVLSATWTNTTS